MGFKLRSGNGPLQFKQMGASPAKQTEHFTETQEDKAIRIKKQQDYNKLQETAKTTKGTTEYKAEQERIKQEKADAETAKTKADADAKAKVEASRGDHEGQVKKQGKLDKISKRQHEQYLYDQYEERGIKEGFKGFKKWSKEQIESGNVKNQEDWAASDLNKETKREARLKKEVNMTPEEYKANQARKKQKREELGQELQDLGASIGAAYGKGGSGNISSNMANIKNDREIKTKTEAREAEMHKSKLAVNEQHIERSKALQKATEQGIKVAEENKSGEIELGSTENESIKVIKGSGKNLNENA